MNQLPPEPITQERRNQARIRLEIPIKLSVRGVEDPITALCQDISWGGILFIIPAPLPKGTRTLRIALPWSKDKQITALASLLRARKLLDGRYLVAARFVSLTPRSQSRLERLLNMLIDSAGLGDGHGPQQLVRELEVVANDAEDLRVMLEQIATGRHTVTVFDSYELNQSIRFSIEGTVHLAGIRLRARVIKVEEKAAPGFQRARLYTLTLEFEHPRESISDIVNLLLGELTDTRDLSALSWMETPTTYFAPSTTYAPALSLETVPNATHVSLARCVLETNYPEALNFLTAGWGDVQSFEIMFRELLLGDRSQPGGWSMDAWEELTLLQDVHDLAYGISDERRKFLPLGKTR